MDSVHETPVKRRRTEQGYVNSQSQDDACDTMLLDDYETVATLPVALAPPRTPPRGSMQKNQESQEDDTLATIPFAVKETPTRLNGSSQLQSSYLTQPTQIVDRAAEKSSSPISEQAKPVVQVAASSPLPPSPKITARPPAGSIVSRMAPPGTQFRPPRVVRPPPHASTKPLPSKKPEPVDISSDDEGPVYVKDSDEEDERYNRDLKPTIIKSTNQTSGRGSTQSSFGGSFLERFRLNGDKQPDSANSSFSAASTSQTSDTMANAYGNASRRSRPMPPPPQKQNAPARARPVMNISLDEITDYQTRRRVENMRAILPGHSVADCFQALLIKKGNENDAMVYLASKEDEPGEAAIVVKDSDDELSSQQTAKHPHKTAKQQVENKRTIQEKYAAKAGVKASQIADVNDEDQSPVAKKPKRRLIQGRKFQHSPHSSPPAKKQIQRAETPISLDSESDSSPEIEQDSQLEANLLKYLNSCTAEELIDLAQTTKDKAEYVLSQRPFRKLDEVRNVVRQPDAKPGSKRKAKPVAIGDKIVEDCEKMWTGFQAVDQLVQQCESMGRPVAAAMQKWGVSVYGSGAGSGELDIVSLEDAKSEASAKDSGIGSSPRSSPPSGDDDVLKAPKRTHASFFPQPTSLAEGVTLKDYQVVGVNWLSLLFQNRMSCILADDMGLGKTCQVVSFIAHLRETGVKGPHIVVVPSSVLENWLREFEQFCPDISVMPYHAMKNERPQLMESILENEPEVIITTYTIAKKQEDRSFFRSLKPTCCIFDEGHMLKNPKSEQYRQLMKISCEFRLLLTGTPLQNNLGELIALLGFMMPSVFKEHQEDLAAIFGLKATTSDDDNQHAALLSAQRVARAKSMMTPFILRRKKHQVLKDIPAKHRRVQYCDMTEKQAEKYKEVVDRYRDLMRRRASGERIPINENSNVMMDLRKAAIHPMLFRRMFTDETLSKVSKACKAEEQFAESNPDLIYEDLYYATDMEMQRWCAKHGSTRRFMLKDEPWMDSGKVSALVELLEKYREQGDRVLVFSQFTMVLDVLEEVLETVSMKFARLDGSLDINLRQDLIDKFSRDASIPVFLLSTKAGGAGINLACANKVVVFDSSFNPQDDVQAENRAHRVGQTREVEVVRLVTRATVEEQIHALGQTKLALDDKVAGSGGSSSEALTDDKAAKKAENAGKQEVERLLAQELEEKEE